MSEPYVEERIVQYTEEIFYNGNGIQVDRVRHDDDATVDSDIRDMTDAEKEDYELDDV